MATILRSDVSLFAACLVLCCISELFAIQDATQKQLVLVQLLFRDGLSLPSTLYPKDPNDPKTWDRDLGDITLMGEKQHYLIGRHLRKRYRQLITSNPHEILARSAFRSRYMSSALSQLASLYAPTPEWEFIDDYNWQPVPVSYVPAVEDKYLGPISNCPALEKEMQKSVNSLEGQKILETYKEQLKYWTAHSGMEVKDWNGVVKLFDILSAENDYRKILPTWAQKYWNDMKRLRDVAYKINFNNPNVLKILGGPLLFHMSSIAMRKATGDCSLQTYRMFMHSGGSIHLASVLGALGVFNNKTPPHAATLMMELFKTSSENNDAKDYSIRLAYLNSTTPHIKVGQPNVLTFPGCGEFCPLDFFFSETSRWNNTNWINDCKGL